MSLAQSQPVPTWCPCCGKALRSTSYLFRCYFCHELMCESCLEICSKCGKFACRRHRVARQEDTVCWDHEQSHMCPA